MAISADERLDSLELAESLGINFPLLSDPDLRVALGYGVAMKGTDIAIPSVFVVGTDRRIYWRAIGESIVDRPTVSEILEQAVAAR